MRAVICRELGPPEALEVTEVPTPAPGKGEVLVDVHGCGVNFGDTLIVAGRYQFKPPLPFSPGAEVAGTVAAVGPGVERVAVGDRVMCMSIYGGYAEALVTPAAGLLPVPDGMDLLSASAFVTAFFTVVMGFALIWHIWWMAGVGLLGVAVTMLALLFRIDNEVKISGEQVGLFDRTHSAEVSL